MMWAPRRVTPHMTSTSARNPAAEARALLPDGYLARVLEPSPPAVHDEPWFSDDPAARGESAGLTVVTPTIAGDITWAELAATDPTIADYARHHWLVPGHLLPPVPDNYVESRLDHHRLAYAVVAEARHRANGKFGLRHVHTGFGTPFFGDDEQVRVEPGIIVVQRGSTVETAPITTLAAAADLVGVEPTTTAAEHDSPELGDIHAPLQADESTGRFLGDWFGFATSVLEELRVTPGASDVGRVQLWPGHFDPAVEVGDADQGQRATYGASPGDDGSDEPYLYVGPWGDMVAAPFWNASTFSGAVVPYAELRASTNPHQKALDFFREALDRLSR